MEYKAGAQQIVVSLQSRGRNNMHVSHRSSISNTMEEEEGEEEMGKQTNNTATMLMRGTKNRELMTVKRLPAPPPAPRG